MDFGSQSSDDGSLFPGKGIETAGRIIIKEELTVQLGKLYWRVPGVAIFLFPLRAMFFGKERMKELGIPWQSSG